MRGRGSWGTCALCGCDFSKAGMTRHLESCIRKKLRAGDGQGPIDVAHEDRHYHIRVEGRGPSDYWMHLQVRADASLEDLDDFLRDTWLECCGHLSAFTIRGNRYASDPIEDLNEMDMKAPLGEILDPGLRFLHEYDFGTTTELVLKAVSEHEGSPGLEEAPIQLLARNEPPPLTCNVCGRPATRVCTQCIYLDEGWLCDECAKNHECGEETLLPVVNSPRVGMCGYTGEPAILLSEPREDRLNWPERGG